MKAKQELTSVVEAPIARAPARVRARRGGAARWTGHDTPGALHVIGLFGADVLKDDMAEATDLAIQAGVRMRAQRGRKTVVVMVGGVLLSGACRRPAAPEETDDGAPRRADVPLSPADLPARPPVAILDPYEHRLERPPPPGAHGRLVREGNCLYLDQEEGRRGLAFLNPGARFDERDSAVVLGSTRIQVGRELFVSGTFANRQSEPLGKWSVPLAQDCKADGYWYVETLGAGRPQAADLRCDEAPDPSWVMMIRPQYEESTGLFQTHKEQAERIWRQGFGSVRLCAEKLMAARVGVLARVPFFVSVNQAGRLVSVTSADPKGVSLAECFVPGLKESLFFPPSKAGGSTLVQLEFSRGESDYQVRLCERFRQEAKIEPR